MLQQGLKHFTEIPLTVLGMLIFFVTYMGVLTFTLLGKKTKEKMQRFAAMPLSEDEHV